MSSSSFLFLSVVAAYLAAASKAFTPPPPPSSSNKVPVSSTSLTSSYGNKAFTTSSASFIPTDQILFIEMGWGNDGHGQNVTKAATRACRNSIEFNSLPSIKRLVPGGYAGLKLDVILAVPPAYQQNLDLATVRAVFPYGAVNFRVRDGGMVAPSEFF